MLSFRLVPPTGGRAGFNVNVTDINFQGKVSISMGPGSGQVDIATAGYVFLDIRMWRNSSLQIGRGTTTSA